MKRQFCFPTICILSISSHAYSFLIGSNNLGIPRRRNEQTTELRYDWSSDDFFSSNVDLSAIENDTDQALSTWLCSLSKLERSEPEWIGRDIMTLSPSALLEEQLSSMCNVHIPLFPTEAVRAKFDFQYKCLLLKTIPTLDLTEVLQEGMSNSHPLMLQLVAMPPQCELIPYFCASIDLSVLLYGEYNQQRSYTLLPRESLSRRPEHGIGTPLSDFAEKPTSHELDVIREDLMDRVPLSALREEHALETHRLTRGECLVNKVGSVVQKSFTTNENPCLLWTLGPNLYSTS